MLKSQDCIVLIKLLANPGVEMSQRQLAKTLCISLAEINAGIKRLEEAGLLRKDRQGKLFPNINATEDFLINAIKFFFPGKLGEYTRGTPTAIAVPIFHDKIALGNDPIPVWPDALGEKRGVALDPIHPSIPKALRENPDPTFYELLVLVDAIRSGRPRERDLAATLLRKHCSMKNSNDVNTANHYTPQD
ncbi:MAG: hypothetical protein ACRC0B_07340 [Legionella sp.]